MSRSCSSACHDPFTQWPPVFWRLTATFALPLTLPPLFKSITFTAWDSPIPFFIPLPCRTDPLRPSFGMTSSVSPSTCFSPPVVFVFCEIPLCDAFHSSPILWSFFQVILGIHTLYAFPSRCCPITTTSFFRGFFTEYFLFPHGKSSVGYCCLTAAIFS